MVPNSGSCHFLKSAWGCRPLVTPLPMTFRAYAIWGLFLKTNKTDIEKIPRVLLFLATHHDVYCFKKSMENREKSIHKVGIVLCTNATE